MSPACPVYGFVTHVQLRTGIDIDEFTLPFAEFLAMRGLVVSGNTPILLVSGEATQATDGDRDAVREWLLGRGEIAHFDVGPLSDIGNSA